MSNEPWKFFGNIALISWFWICLQMTSLKIPLKTWLNIVVF